MKRLFFLLLLLFATQISAQTDFFLIGDSNTSQIITTAPLVCDNKYSYTQSLYKSNELMVGEITSISYYHVGGWFNSGVVKVYLKETTQSSLSSFVSLQNSIEVFSDTVILSNGWITFDFYTPYEYSGNNNLVITMIKEGFTTQSNHFFKTRNANSSTRCAANHATPYNINSNPSYSQILNETPIVKVGIIPDEEHCYQPFNLRVDSVSSDLAIISWDNFWQEGSFVGIACKKDTESQWTIVQEGVTDTTYTITGLESHSNYQIKLWTICPFSESSNQIVSLTTLTHPDDCITLPYYNDFDNLEDLSKWKFTNFGENQWHVGPLGNNTRDEQGHITQGNGIFISNDDGETNYYDNTSASVSHFSTYIEILDSLHYGLSFDYKVVGDVFNDYMKVSLIPANANLSNSVPSSITLAQVVNNTGVWSRFTTELSQSIAPGYYQLVFTWVNDHCDGENPPIAIDNIEITHTNCEKISGTQETMLDVNGSIFMSLNIIDMLNESASYTVEYKLLNETQWSYMQGTNPLTIPYLPYSSVVQYRVYANCDIDNTSMPSNFYLTQIPCGIIDSLAYLENFDYNLYTLNSISIPHCWHSINRGNTSIKWSLQDYTGVNGSNALSYNGNPNDNQTEISDWIISPIFALNGNQRINFVQKLSSNSQLTHFPKIDVYVLNTDLMDYASEEDTSYFDYLTTIHDSNLETVNFKTAEILLNDYVGSYRIAFVINEPNPSFVIDNFKVSDIPDCLEVNDVQIYPYSSDAVLISYTNNNITSEGVVVAYAEEMPNQDFDPNTAQTIVIPANQELPYILSGLENQKTYLFALRQNCDGTWSETKRVTLPYLYSTPFSFDLNTEETTPQMRFISAPTSNKWIIGQSYNQPLSNISSQTGRALYVSNNNGNSASFSTGFVQAYAYMNVDFNSGAEYEFSFDWKCQGINPNAYFRVYLVPFGYSMSENYAITPRLHSSTQWQREHILLPAGIYQGAYQLIFYWESDSYSSNNILPAIVDNISINTLDCARLIDLDLQVADTESGLNLTIDLIDEFNTNSSYILLYKKETDSLYTEITGLSRESFPYTISQGLEYNENYQLQIGVECQGESEALFSGEIFSITTPCAIIETPLEIDFEENILEEQYCWSKHKGRFLTNDFTYTTALSDNSAWTVGQMQTNTDYSSKLNILISGSNIKDWAISPSINLGDGSITKQVILDLALRDWYGETPTQIDVDDKFIFAISMDNGVTWNQNNAVIFAEQDSDTVHNLSSLTNETTPYVIKLVDENNQALSGVVKFAFYVESTIEGGYNYLCIDNFTINNWTQCQAPRSISIDSSSLRHNAATLKIKTIDDNTTYFQYVVVEGQCSNFDTINPLICSQPSLVLENLSAQTLYSVAVRSFCGNNMYSPWVMTSFTTLAQPQALPFETTFSDNVQWQSVATPSCSNAWCIGSATSEDLNGQSAYISKDGGISYEAEAPSSSFIAYLYKDFSFGQTDSSFELILDWKGIGSVLNGTIVGGISIYLMDIAPLSITTLPPNPIITLYGSQEWQNERISLGHITGDKRLVIATFGYYSIAERQTPAAIDNLKLIVSPCAKIENLEALSPLPNSISLSWESTGADSYLVYYRNETSTEYLTLTTNTNFITIDNLNPLTRYLVKVKGVCGEAESIISDEISINTLQDVVNLPYICDFEQEGANGWLLKNGTCTNKWWVGRANSSTNSTLFVTCDNGLTSQFDKNNTCVVIAEKQIQLGESDSIRISFDLKVGGVSLGDYLKVFFVPIDTVFEPSSSVSYFARDDYQQGVIISNSTIDSEYTLSQVTQTTNMSVVIPNTPNEIRKLVFVWVNSFRSGDNQGAIIDNVLVEEVEEIIPCISPIENSVIASSITSNSAEISWIGNDELHNAWNVYYKSQNDTAFNSIIVSDNSNVQLTNLAENTLYQVFVTTNCQEEESVSTDTISFQTECMIIQDFPYFMGFEGSDFACWSGDVENDSTWVILDNSYADGYTPASYEGNQYAYHALSTFDSSMLISPRLNIENLEIPYLKFSYILPPRLSNNDRIEVLYRENQESEWIRLRLYTSSQSNWYQDTISLLNQSQTYQIAFRRINKNGRCAGIDAVSIYDAAEIDDGGLLDVAKANQLEATLYPNPAKHQVTIRVENLNSSAKVIMSDTQGRILREEEMNAGEKELTLNLKGLKSGVYYIKLKTDKAVSTQKLIVE